VEVLAAELAPDLLRLDGLATWGIQLMRPGCRRDPPQQGFVALIASRLPALATPRAQGRGPFFFDHQLNGFNDLTAYLRLEVLVRRGTFAPPAVASAWRKPPIVLA
jgi:hypothetical protein